MDGDTRKRVDHDIEEKIKCGLLGAEMDGGARSGRADPTISWTSAPPVITSLSADGERLFWRRRDNGESSALFHQGSLDRF